MKTAIPLLLLSCCFLAWGSLPAMATADCGVSTSGVAFGSYDSLGTGRRDTIGTITVTCTGNPGDAVTYSLSLDTVEQGGFRVMTNGAHQLNYFIFADNGYTQFWRDGTGGSVVVNDSYTMDTYQTSRSYPMYGRIPAGQNQATSGAYGGNVTITLVY
jgi:spore coat protein U-like protein